MFDNVSAKMKVLFMFVKSQILNKITLLFHYIMYYNKFVILYFVIKYIKILLYTSMAAVSIQTSEEL